MVEILYEDEALIVAKKPAGVDAQASRGLQPDMVSLLQNHLAEQAKKAGRMPAGPPYVAVVHRLDKPVRGVMVYAKTRQAAAKLSRQLQAGEMRKEYCALVRGQPQPAEGSFTDLLAEDRRQNRSYPVPPDDPRAAGAKPAQLLYHTVEDGPEREYALAVLGWAEAARQPGVTFVRVRLLTGRRHQIRVQFAARGMPLVGDRRYGPRDEKSGCGLALCAWSLTFRHPVSGQEMTFEYSTAPQRRLRDGGSYGET